MSVRVLHGRVEVRRERAAAVVLAAGEQWSAPVAAATPSSSTAASAPAAPSPTARPIERLFQEGWAALSAGEPGRAAELLDKAALADPADPLAEDAAYWRAVALGRDGRGPASASALGAFLARYPRSARAGEASAMLGWLLLDEGDVDGAGRAFRAAAADPAEAVRRSAQKGLGVIAARQTKGR